MHAKAEDVGVLMARQPSELRQLFRNQPSDRHFMPLCGFAIVLYDPVFATLRDHSCSEIPSEVPPIRTSRAAGANRRAQAWPRYPLPSEAVCGQGGPRKTESSSRIPITRSRASNRTSGPPQKYSDRKHSDSLSGGWPEFFIEVIRDRFGDWTPARCDPSMAR